MSALPPIADNDRRLPNIRFVPIADIMTCAKKKDHREAVSPKSDQCFDQALR